MPTLPARPVGARPASPDRARVRPGEPAQRRVVVAVAAAVTVVARLPFLTHVPGRDEAGFLLVGGQWSLTGHLWGHGGSSLYGAYWVDRPPLLISIFGLADSLGGLVPLRLIGCLAAAVVVVGTAYVAGRVGGPRAAGWTAVLAAAMTASPLLGSLEVNGELLSAPFVVLGLAAATVAIQDHRSPRPHRTGRAQAAAALAGAATLAAMLVKQNIADVGVFAVVAVLVAVRRRALDRAAVLRLVVSYAGGALACLVVMTGWTVLHGTSPAGVFYAMYPFRVRAAALMAASSSHTADLRLGGLGLAWVLSGGAVVMALVVRALVARRLGGAKDPAGPVVWGLVATTTFDLASIVAGGSYWSHYLVELVVPVSVLAGLLVARGQRGTPTTVVAAVVVGVGALVATLGTGHSSTGTTVGRAIGAASRPGDTIVTAYGNADLTWASGLRSPYPYLWSLPTRTLDPRLHTLESVLAGPHAPTWFVSWHSTPATPEDDGAGPARVLAQRYQRLGLVDGVTVYLRDGADRTTPVVPDQSSEEQP